MVNAEEFKNEVRRQVSQDYRLEFLGKDFNFIVNSLTETKAEKIYQWISRVVVEMVQPITIGSKKPYKEWMVNQLLTFRYPLNINNVEYRILLVKVKNSVYVEFHLGDHKYYDKVRKDLNLKRSSY